jgi:hypothetical protein
MPDLDLVTLDPATTVAEARIVVASHIALTAPHCLIVDTFPRGLVGELEDILCSIPGRKVFVQRDLNPEYAAAFDLNTFVSKSYDLVLIPGEAAEHGIGPSPRTVTTAPWLVRSSDEILTRDRARDLLGLHRPKPCVIVCAAGNRHELAWYGTVAAHLLESACCDVRCIAPLRPDTCPLELWVSYWPALDLYAAGDVMVGGAGYNTIHQSLACGVPLVTRPWPRKYDRQALRASRAAAHGRIIIVDAAEDAAAAARAVLESGPQDQRNSNYYNGVGEAVASIVRMLQPNRETDIQSVC